MAISLINESYTTRNSDTDHDQSTILLEHTNFSAIYPITPNTGHRNSPAIYSKLLEVSIRIQMRGPTLQNSIKTAIPAHLWPFKMDENCQALHRINLV
jgi:hypothetical protein